VTEQREEILGSKRQLEEIVGRPVTSFAYPFGRIGDYTSDTMMLLREAGFDRACTTYRATVLARTDPLQMPRIHIYDSNADEFASAFSRWFGV
jgi:hypothetical protein